MFETFLIILAVLWLIAASLSDFKKREIPDWISLSLIALALSYRAFYSIIYWKDYFTPGLIGFAVFMIIGEGIYRIGFGGGDAKLLMALGCILPFSLGFWQNIYTLGFFFIVLMFVGAIYGFTFSFAIAIKNFNRFSSLFKKEFIKRKCLFCLFIPVFLILLIISFFNHVFIALAILSFVVPFVFSYSKALEEVMVKQVYSKQLVLGDWLYENMRIKGKTIKPHITGLDENELKLLKSYKGKIKVKDGIPFTVSFLIAFVVVIYLWYSNWSFLNLFSGLW